VVESPSGSFREHPWNTLQWVQLLTLISNMLFAWIQMMVLPTKIRANLVKTAYRIWNHSRFEFMSILSSKILNTDDQNYCISIFPVLIALSLKKSSQKVIEMGRFCTKKFTIISDVLRLETVKELRRKLQNTIRIEKFDF
jgi:hypothetical protein